ncbi:Mobile element protein [Vibrio mytili]
MYRVKQLLGGKLSLRNYNAQVGETYAMIKALNKLTGLGMPETQYVVQELNNMGLPCLLIELSNIYGRTSGCNG